MEAIRRSMTPHVRTLIVVACYVVPLLAATWVRLSLPSFFEFETQEDTVRSVAILENGDLPLYGIGHIRFLGAALGPLVYYLKAIPHIFVGDPAGELVLLWVLHLVGLVFSMLLAGRVISAVGSVFDRGRIGSDTGKTPTESLFKPHVAAFVSGLFLAFSVHAQSLTAHAHPSNFAGTLVPPFLYGLYRYLTGGSRRWLLLTGLCFGIMSQLYQLTLFAPALVVMLFVLVPRRPTARDIWSLLAPIMACYVPYLLSELATGFWNTGELLSVGPGPQDAGMVESDWAYNLHTLVNTAVEHFRVPEAMDLVLLVAAFAGFVTLVLACRRAPPARFVLAFALFYGLLPAVALGAPRFQLILPTIQIMLALGCLVAGRWLVVIWRGGTASRVLAAGAICLALVTSAFFSTTPAGWLLRDPLFYPMRMLMAEPLGRTPSLMASRTLALKLRTEFGIGLEDLSSCVHSPFGLTADYGLHYVMRAVGDKADLSLKRVCPVMVYDDLFPYEVSSAQRFEIGGMEVVALDATVLDPDRFMLDIRCDDQWCAERHGPFSAWPGIRFFWGCGEFRDLDNRVGVPADECEELLVAPPHDRWYTGPLVFPEADPRCDECRQTILLGVPADCRTLVELDGEPLDVSWKTVNERDFGFVAIPPHLSSPGEHGLRIGILGCAPRFFDLASFSGRKRQIPSHLADRRTFGGMSP